MFLAESQAVFLSQPSKLRSKLGLETTSVIKTAREVSRPLWLFSGHA